MPETQRHNPCKNTPRLRDGVMKRGSTWSYVIRVKDPETGISRPRWVGGFATEQEAKAARDEARVNARRGQYIDRNSISVAAYLDQWLEAHAVEVKPKTLQDYRHLINRHVQPHIGELRLQAISPARLTKLHRSWPQAAAGTARACPRAPSSMSTRYCAKRSVTQLSLTRSCCPIQSSAPADPERPAPNRDKCGRPPSSGPSSTLPGSIGCSPSTGSLRTPALGAASCSTSAGGTLTWTSARSVSPARPLSSRDSASREPPRAAGPAPSASTPTRCRCSRSTASARPVSGCE